MTFREELNELKNLVGSRNAHLVRIAIKGLAEGLSPDQVKQAFADTDCGEPPLTDAEVERAIARGKSYSVGEANTNSVRFRVKMRQIEKDREGTSPEERGFVRRMISAGKSVSDNPDEPTEAFRALTDLMPHKWRGDSRERRHEQAQTFLRTLFPDDDAFVFATNNIRMPRDRRRIYRPSELFRFVDDYHNRTADKSNPDGYEKNRGPYRHNIIPAWYRTEHPDECPEDEILTPTHIGINYYTGMSKKISGRDSYANKDVIARRNHALIEFDLMSIFDQCWFWTGVIRTKSLDLLTLVHSGAKSLHGVVRVPEMQSGDDLFGNVSAEAAEQQWKRNVQKLWRLCCSDEEVSFRCDAACKDTTRMTRFPGGLREGIIDQRLVWWNIDSFNSNQWINK